MFPPRAGQCAYVIDGAHTEMCVTEYSNRVVVVVTQVGKLGTVFHITTDGDETALQDAAMMLRVDPNAMNDKVRVRTLIGKRDDALLSACARHVGEVLVSKGCEKEIILALGLRAGLSMDAHRAVASLAVERVAELMQA